METVLQGGPELTHKAQLASGCSEPNTRDGVWPAIDKPLMEYYPAQKKGNSYICLNCGLLHFPLAQFYFTQACLASYALHGHCSAFESSLWSISAL